MFFFRMGFELRDELSHGEWTQRFTIFTEARVARDLKDHLPVDVTALLTGPGWKGGPLVVLHDAHSRPPSAMLGKNFMWLRAFVKEFPSKARLLKLSPIAQRFNRLFSKWRVNL